MTVTRWVVRRKSDGLYYATATKKDSLWTDSMGEAYLFLSPAKWSDEEAIPVRVTIEPVEAPAPSAQRWRCQGCGKIFDDSSMAEFTKHGEMHRAASTLPWCGPVVPEGEARA